MPPQPLEGLDVEYFNFVDRRPQLWLAQSRALHDAAKTLFVSKPKEHFPISLMLGGYATETILKFTIIGNAKANGPPTHNLEKLVKTAGLRINREDRQFLAYLSKYTSWAGRYPTPLKVRVYDGPAAFWHLARLIHPTTGIERRMWRRAAI